jgi:hypothetical protein
VNSKQAAAMLVAVREPLLEAMFQVNNTLLGFEGTSYEKSQKLADGAEPLTNILKQLDKMIETLSGTNPTADGVAHALHINADDLQQIFQRAKKDAAEQHRAQGKSGLN